MSNDLSHQAGMNAPNSLSASGQYLVLVVAFLGWFMGGVQLSITSLSGVPAATDLLDVAVSDTDVAVWYGLLKAGFLAGAAAGGLLFGWIGDRWGRTKALGLAVLCYSCMTGIAYFAQGPWQFLLLRFLAGLGVGGTWPNGVSLVSEAWSNLSRPMLAGIMGTSANIGIWLLSYVASHEAWRVAPETWQWVMVVGFAPVVLGLFTLVAVPESPRWLASRSRADAATSPTVTRAEIFRPPLLTTTLIGIGLATVPLVGGWGSSSWMIPWADAAAEVAPAGQGTNAENGTTSDGETVRKSAVDQTLKARIASARALTGSVGSLLGGFLAHLLGRRLCYFLMSVFAFGSAQYIFWALVPTDPSFLYWVATLGFFSGVYFGWLPLCLPELFVTRVRSTGAGVSFNFGRILTVVTIFTTSALMKVLGHDFALIGKITSLVYVLGMIVILFAPDTSEKELSD